MKDTSEPCPRSEVFESRCQVSNWGLGRVDDGSGNYLNYFVDIFLFPLETHEGWNKPLKGKKPWTKKLHPWKKITTLGSWVSFQEDIIGYSMQIGKWDNIQWSNILWEFISFHVTVTDEVNDQLLLKKMKPFLTEDMHWLFNRSIAHISIHKMLIFKD